MDAIDFSGAEHSGVIARILGFAQRPRCCEITRRAMEDIVKLTLTKAAVLEAIQDHLSTRKPTYVQMQSCGLRAYILLPCVVDCYELYVKLQMPPGEELMVVVSVHDPEFEPRRKKTNVKRTE